MDMKCQTQHVFVAVTLTAATACIVMIGGLDRTKQSISGPLLRYPAQNVSTDSSHQKISTVTSHQSKVEDYGVYDILHEPQITFNEAYKNPCWFGKSGNGPITDGRLHCLPYFYLLGVKKSGTTDLYSRIERHPEYVYPGWKESQWLARTRFRTRTKSLKRLINSTRLNISSIAFYVSMFDKAARIIKAKRDQTKKAPYYRMITGDATPSHWHMHTNWETLPGNEHLTEPKYTNFHYLKHLTPDMKIVLVFRDPVSRLFSDFNHETRVQRTRYQSIPEAFHKQSIILVNTYEDCFRVYSIRRCIYNNTLKQELKKKGVLNAHSFVAGFYEFHMRELFQLFEQKSILPLLMTDYIEHMNTTLTKVFDFLGMKKLRSSDWHSILRTASIRNKSKRDTHMLEKTQDLLKHFYRPFNEQMAELMKDKRYAFQ